MILFTEAQFMLYCSVLSFCFGACLGSFLNVCIHRIPLDQSVVVPRSHCPHCKNPIPFYHNIPLLSYLLLRGKCANCRAGISPRYFMVELLTAVLIWLVWHQYGLDPRTLIYWMVIGGLILGTFVDLEHMILPDRVTIGGMVLGPLFSLAVPMLHGTTDRLEALVASGIGLAAGFGTLWLVSKLGKWAFKKDAMGFGDVKLLGALGAFLGWKAVFFTIFFSSLIGSAVGISLILTRNKEWQSRIPFGPYLAVAAVLWILWGEGWWNAYFGWMADPAF
jgi:leader peptidase (prepilin peptidase)/N-methyltransferase